jgi:hypothetical protein
MMVRTGQPDHEGITEMNAETTETVEQVNSYRIHEVNMDAARALVEKVNRKARRYGLSEYTLTVSEPIEVPVMRKSLFHHIDGSVDPEPIGFDLYFDVQLVGEMPQIDGYTFVGVLDYTEDAGVITRPVPGVDVDLSIHRVRPNECDHCHKNRNRNETYVLMNAEGDTMQVGSTCIQPYMGLTVSGLAWLSGEPFAELEEMREPSESGPRPKPRYSVDYIIRAACAVETVFGFVSKAAAAFDQTPTVSYVYDLISPPTTGRAAEEFQKWARRIDQDKAEEKAAIVRDFAKTIEGNSEYAENMRTLANGETVNSRNIGLLVSAVGAYNRAMGDVIKREAKKVSEFVGNVGDKIDIVGTVERSFTFENSFSYYGGMSEILIIRGEDGNVYKWKASTATDFEVGDRVSGKATIKAHEDYKGEKQTTVTRAKLVKIEK